MSSQKIYQPGEDIGPYRVVRLIAIGGMSTLYEAQPRPELRSDLLRMGIERVAVKVASLNGHPGGRRERKQLVARIEREIETLVHLMKRTQGHPNVVKVYDAGMDDGVPYYAMEYVDGLTLDEVMGQRPRFGQMMHVFGELCGAVAFLHDQGICHRDVKPSNVVLRYEDGSPVLLDFGICLPQGRRTLTRAGELVGTPHYLSPEYAIHWLSNPGEAYLAAPTDDVWALGVVLYELLTGGVPWRAPPDRREDLLREIRDVAPLHPCDVYSQVPRALGDVTLRLLEKDPGKRPANAFEALDLVAAAAEGTDVLGRIPPRRPPPAPKKTGWTGALVRLATPRPAGNDRVPPPPPAERREFRFKAAAMLCALCVVGFVLFLAFRPRGATPDPQCKQPAQPTMAARLPESKRPAEESPVFESDEGPPAAAVFAPDAGVIAIPMPDEPLKDQKRPPCIGRIEVERKDGCWIEAKGTAPCPDGWYEEAGKCYEPVMLRKRRPFKPSMKE